MKTEIEKILNKKLEQIAQNKEKILEAFIAETGCLPSEIEMVHEPKGIDGWVWYVRKRKKVRNFK